MKKKLLGIMSLSAVAMTAFSLTGCGLSDEELFEFNKNKVFIENTQNNMPQGENGYAQGSYGYVAGDVRIFTAFTPEFIKKGGKVEFSVYTAEETTDENGNTVYVTKPGTEEEAEGSFPLNQLKHENGYTVTVNNPFAGTQTKHINLVATITMGSRVEEIVWSLHLAAKKIEFSALQSIMESLYAKDDNAQSNQMPDHKNKVDDEGNPIYGFTFSVPNRQREVFAPFITANEKIECLSANALFNITTETSNSMFSAASSLDEDTQKMILQTLVSADNLGKVYKRDNVSYTFAELIVELCENKTIYGKELSESDRNSYEATGMDSLIKKLCNVIKLFPTSLQEKEEGYKAYKALVDYSDIN